MILLAPSGSGKTVLLSNLILNIYRGCFERIYIFSPSIDLDYMVACQEIPNRHHESH
jgi:type IV secretory pathway VirB4 component